MFGHIICHNNTFTKNMLTCSTSYPGQRKHRKHDTSLYTPRSTLVAICAIPADRQTIIPMTLGCIADVILIVCGTISAHSGMIWCHLCDRHASQSMGAVLTKYPFGSALSTTKATGLQIDDGIATHRLTFWRGCLSLIVAPGGVSWVGLISL